MWKWARRVGGTIIAALVLIHGLPGFIDDSITWLSWIEDMDLRWVIYPIGIVGGLLLGTSEWWWPLVFSSAKKRSQEDTNCSKSPTDSDLEQFRACLPHLERCRELVKPFASPLGSLNMGLEYLSTGGDKFIELIGELGYLARRLNALGIRYPDLYGAKDESDSHFRVRLRIWSMYLAELAVMIRQDDLAGARLLEPLRQPDASIGKDQ